MRKTWLTLALVAMIALPVLAQRGRGGFGFGGMGGMFRGDNLLLNKSVQKELKLDDKQTKEIAEITKTNQESMGKAFRMMFGDEREEGQKLMRETQEATAKSLKKYKESLTSDQHKRFQEIEVQQATKSNDPNIFKHSGVVKALKLTPKQQETVKETISDFEKDSKEVMAEAKGGGKGKGKAIREKLDSLRKEAYEKITKSLTDNQQKTIKELGGKEFELKMDFGKGGFGKKGKKKDDF